MSKIKIFHTYWTLKKLRRFWVLYSKKCFRKTSSQVGISCRSIQLKMSLIETKNFVLICQTCALYCVAYLVKNFAVMRCGPSPTSDSFFQILLQYWNMQGSIRVPDVLHPAWQLTFCIGLVWAFVRSPSTALPSIEYGSKMQGDEDLTKVIMTKLKCCQE